MRTRNNLDRRSSGVGAFMTILLLLLTSISFESLAVSITRVTGSPCVGQSMTYTLIGASCSSFSWSASPGATIVSGQFTNSFVVKWNSPAVNAWVSCSYACTTGNGSTSYPNFDVSSIVTPSVSLSLSPNPACQGQSVVFTASPTNGGSAPTYKFFVDGTQVSSGSSNTYTYSTVGVSGNKSVYVQMTSNFTCVTTAVVNSTTQTLTVNTKTTPFSVLPLSGGTMCTGTEGNARTYVASVTPLSPTPTYQWYVDGNIQSGQTASSFSTALAEGHSVSVVVGVPTACTNTVTQSFTAHYTQSTTPTASININKTTFCSGETASLSNAVSGANTSGATYSWLLNGNQFSTSSSTSIGMTTDVNLPNAFNSGDVITVNVSGLTGTCLTSTTASGNSSGIPIVINATTTPGVTVSTGQSTLCPGNTTTINANPVNGGSSPTYEWRLDGVVVTGSGASYTTPSSLSGGSHSVTAKMFTTAQCPTSPSVTSSPLTIVMTPSVTLSPASQTICSGQTASINISSDVSSSFTWITNLRNAEVIDASTSTSISGTYSNADGFNSGDVTYTVWPVGSSCGGTSATVSVVSVPQQPKPVRPLFYGTTPVKFTAIARTGSTTQWYSAAAGGAAFATGNTYTNSSVNDPLTYYVSFKNSGNSCESPRSQLTAIIVHSIDPPSIIEETVRVSGKLSDGDVNALTIDSLKSVTVTYADGLSRTVQAISVKASPGKNDVVTPVEYDSYGRTSKQYLPYTRAITHVTDSITGVPLPAFQTGYKTDQLGFYTASGDKIANDNMAYAQAAYEASPLGRLLEQGKAGVAWQPGNPTTKRIAYSLNRSADGDDVRIFNTVFTVGSAVTTQLYADTTLLRTTVTDENGHKNIVFANFAGKTLMRKQQLDTTINSTNVDYLRTAYVYDELGRLTYIIPPGGYVALQSNSWVLTQAILDAHLYQFVYDNRGRVTKKKTPGQDWIYYGYDKLNRVVLVQDGNTRPLNKWVFIKYDQQGRTIMTGFYTNATQTTLPAIQSILDGLYASGVWYETRGTVLNGYTNQSFPTQNADASPLDVMSVSYFDNYDFDNNGSADYTYDNAHVSGLPTATTPYIRGAATGTQTRIFGTTTWLKHAVFYDNNGRAIQTQGNNHLNTSAIDKGSVVYDFEGKAVTSKNYHNAGGTNQVTTDLTPGFDHNGQLKYLMHNINGLGGKKVVNYQVNELGQVVMKQLHNVSGSTYLQNVDYRYNINGWLTSINNSTLTDDAGVTNGDTGDYFGMEIVYESRDVNLGNKKNFNGNISAVKWKSFGSATGTQGQSGYSFAYDRTDKLLSASYKKSGTSGWNVDVNTIDEVVAYDHNGNITSLQRKRKDPTAGAAQLMDALSYTYASGNLLSKVEDSSGITDGFNNGVNTTTEYTYDANGNLTADNNKGISAITYNLLGKPGQITFSDGRTIVYTYDGSGAKLKMVTTVSGTTTTTDYVNGFVYTNGVLDFFSSPEGRVKKNGSNFEYQYNITDHQGNTRILFTSATPTAQTVTATYETAAQATEVTQFQNYPSSSGINPVSANNHTVGGTKSQYLHAGTNGQVGVAKSYSVFPGDQVKIEAYARYTASSGSSNLANFAAALLSAFSLSAPVGGEVGTPRSAINSWGTLAAGGYGDGSNDSSHPKAFVNILIFDKNYNFLDVAYAQVTSSGSPAYLSATYTVKEPGYAYLYISNENATLVDVYFDDVAMTYTPTNVIQSNEYYPFGLQTADSWTRENNKNNFLYDGGSELNTTSGLYDLPYRNYDAALGRFFQVDPMAGKDHTLSPFVYGGDNPVNLNDPSGLMVDYSTSMANPDYEWQLRKAAMDAENLAQNANLWGRDVCSSCPGYGGGGSWEMWGDAISVRNGGMSIEEYAQKYGQTTSNPEAISAVVNYLTTQGGMTTKPRENAEYGSGDSGGVAQTPKETPKEINDRFGDSFSDEIEKPLNAVPMSGTDADIRDAVLRVINGFSDVLLTDTRGQYSMRPIYWEVYELNLTTGSTRLNQGTYVNPIELSQDPQWQNPGRLLSPSSGPVYPAFALSFNAPSDTGFFVTVTFQKLITH